MFEDCELDVDRWELRRAGSLIHVQRKPWEVLLYLIWNRHRMVSADELLEKLWPDSKVTMASVAAAIRDARRAIGDDGRAQRMILTRKSVGFRFVAQIEGPLDLAAADNEGLLELPSRSTRSAMFSSDCNQDRVRKRVPYSADSLLLPWRLPIER